MTYIFFALVATAFVVAGWRELAWVAPSADARGDSKSPMAELTDAMIGAAGNSVTLAIGLVGVMALFLGLMKVAEEGGLLAVIARLMRPLLVRLFPEVPADHPAMGAMIMNVSANVVGLGNAATPFGIRAMEALDALNPLKGTATNAMVLFLAINTASVTLLPTSVIALRAAAGSNDPAGVLPTTLFATLVATAVAVIAAKLGERWWPADSGAALAARDPAALRSFDDVSAAVPVATVHDGYPLWVSYAALGAIVVLIPLTVIYGRAIGPWIVPGLMLGLLAFGLARRVNIYDAFVEGGKDGFTIALRIIPYLVAILVAIGMLRASGAMDGIIGPIAAVTEPLGLPAEALTMGLLRMLSGSGAFGLLASILNDPTIGPDSYTGYLASTIMGSTETTFYVLAVYFGSVGVKRIRHALVAGLLSDIAGIAASVAAVKMML